MEWPLRQLAVATSCAPQFLSIGLNSKLSLSNIVASNAWPANSSNLMFVLTQKNQSKSNGASAPSRRNHERKNNRLFVLYRMRDCVRWYRRNARMEGMIMAFLLPFTTRQVCKAMAESMIKYDNAPDKDDFCNPDVPLVIKLKNKKYGVLSYGGDPDEEGLVLELTELK